MQKLHTFDHIINSVADYTGVAVRDMNSLNITLDGDLYYVEFDSEYMSYVMYINGGGAVLGFMSVPLNEHSTNTVDLLEDRLCA